MWPLWKLQLWEDSPQRCHLNWLAADLAKRFGVENKLPRLLTLTVPKFLKPQSLVATCSETGFLSLVETSSCRVVLDKDLGHGWLGQVAFAPSGEHVAACSEKGFLSLVETCSGNVVLDKDLGHGWLGQVAFAPSGEHVAACSHNGFLSLVETCSGNVVLDKDLDHGCLREVAFSPSGEHVATCSLNGFLSLVEISSGNVVLDKHLGHGVLFQVAFASDTGHIYSDKPVDATSNLHVIDVIEHSDPPAIIPKAEAAELVEQHWLSWVQLRDDLEPESLFTRQCDLTCETIPKEASGARQFEYGEKIFLMNMSRIVQDYQSAMHKGRELEPVRTVLQECGHSSCIDPPGAHIFVHPTQYVAVKGLLESIDLKPHHVVVAESLAPLFFDALNSLPSKKHVRIRRMSAMAIVSDDGDDLILVERTFFRERLSHIISPRSVTESTTIARGVRNPRHHSQPF